MTLYSISDYFHLREREKEPKEKIYKEEKIELVGGVPILLTYIKQIVW